MKDINTAELFKTCERVCDRCIKVADSRHNATWLYEQLVRYFNAEQASEAVTIPVIFNTPLLGEAGEATISRTGFCVMSRKEQAK